MYRRPKPVPGLRRSDHQRPTPEGPCPRCLMLRPMAGDLPGPADADATIALAAEGSGESTEPTSGDPEATGGHRLGP